MSSATPMQQTRTETSNQNLSRVPQLPSPNQQSTEQTDRRDQISMQRQLHDAANKGTHASLVTAVQRMAKNSARNTQLQGINSRIKPPVVQHFEDKAPKQRKTPQHIASDSALSAPKENNTGLPDNLKSGIESLSGMSMDHVKVHYNSSQPAQFMALAFAQGKEIHVAPGQEQHLPHEAWHLVQQAQGRVMPTKQMKTGVLVNDDAGLEAEADAMGMKALSVPTSELTQSQHSGASNSENIAQLARLYDDTLSPQKANLMNWLVEENQTLGLSTSGTSGSANANKKSNFSWHHILAFADLSKHGEGKTQPANHGGNVRLGPMKNRIESSDVSGGTAVDYSYLPLNENGEIVLDQYSQDVFDEKITADDSSSLTTELSSQTYDKTPQSAMFAQGKKANAFAEWFFESQVKTELLTKEAISEIVAGAEPSAINTFVSAINKQFDSLLRTYKYYNKKGEVQTTSGVPMTDISEGNFGHIVISGGSLPKTIAASNVIDSLLCEKKWIMRGSQGAILDNSTTYKFGIAKNPLLITLVETAAAQIDLADYQQLKLEEFEENLQEEFRIFRSGGTESDDFDQEKETNLIKTLVENMKTGADSYTKLWSGVDESAVADQYVRVMVDDDTTYWPFPVPDADLRESTLQTEKTIEGTSEAWEKLFVDGLSSWDGKTPLFEEGTTARDAMYIDFGGVQSSIANNEQKWSIKKMNQERRNNSAAQLPPNFLSSKTTLNQVENAVANEIDSDSESYLSSSKESIPLKDIKDELKGKLNGHVNVTAKRIKGIEKDLDARKQAFGEHFAGFVQATIWNVINSTKIPTNIEGTEGKKWDELGDTQVTLYEAWLEQQDVATKIDNAATSIKLIATLP